MRVFETLRLAVENLAANALRSALTVLGVVFGVGAVIAMLSIGAGAERQALETIARLGLHNVVVQSLTPNDDELQEIRRKSQGLSLRDAEAITDAVPGVELVAPKAVLDPYLVRSEQGETDAVVWGVAASHDDLVELPLAEGRFLDALDERSHEQVAVLGDRVRRDLFGDAPVLGRLVKVDDVWLEVIGVLASLEAQAESGGVSAAAGGDVVYVPVSTALRKFDRRPLDAPLGEIVVRLEESASPARAARAIDTLLERLHAGERDYELVVPEALVAESRRTQRLYSLVMGAIAGISLLVGGIGIMNIMLANVLERTREIGVRRAVGARRRDILLQFVGEAFALSVFGGLAGVVLGIAIAKGVAASAGWPTLVEPSAVILAVGVAVLVGVGSGLYPALRAAELDPVDSLRWE